MKTLVAALLVTSSLSFAAPPPVAAAPSAPPPTLQGRGQFGPGGPGGWGAEGPEQQAARERRMRMMLVVGVAEALSLSEAEALKLADRIKGFDERRRPLREQMHESMKQLKAAAQGDAAALPFVDQATQKVLDGRAQMAALDREMFLSVSKDLAPQKRAQLALFLARFREDAKRWHGGGGDGEHGRRHRKPGHPHRKHFIDE